RAAGFRPRGALRLGVRLVRHGRAPRATRRVLDDRADGGEVHCTSPRTLELRRLERQHGRAPAQVQRQMDRAAPPALRQQNRGLFVNNSGVPETTYFALRGLLQHGWSARETSGVVWMFAPGRGSTTPTLQEPYRLRAYFCQGWYGSLPAPRGRYMSETHAPFWV